MVVCACRDYVTSIDMEGGRGRARESETGKERKREREREREFHACTIIIAQVH